MKIFNQLSLDREMLVGQDIVFDMDGTLIEGDIGETLFYHTLLTESLYSSSEDAWFDPIQQNGLKNPILLSKKYADLLIDYKAKLSAGSFGEAYMNAAKWLEKYKREDIEHLIHAFLTDQETPKTIKCQITTNNSKANYIDIPYGAHIKPGMHEVLKCFLERGANLWIVSASPQTVCEIVAKKTGIDRKRVLGVKVSVSGEESPRFPWGPDKLKVLKEAGVIHPLVVFGNGEGDVEMLAIAKYPIVVEDGSAKMIELADNRGWWIYPCRENPPE